MTIAFTICSLNYLARARVLADSLRRHAAGIPFRVILVDRVEGRIRLGDWSGLDLEEVEGLRLPGFSEMSRRYRVVELNTAVKPLVFQALMDRHPLESDFVYFDPDACVYGSLEPILEALPGASALLTPHVLMPGASLDPQLEDLLRHGVYNLGFMAVHRRAETERLLAWWSRCLRDRCANDLAKGRFYDQLCMNGAPVFFEDVRVLRHPGANVAFWNLHERRVESRSGEWRVNDEPLIFYHFSHYRPEEPDRMCPWGGRVSFEARPELRVLYDGYRRAVLAAGHEKVRHLECSFTQQSRPSVRGVALRGRNPLVRRVGKKLQRLADRFIVP